MSGNCYQAVIDSPIPGVACLGVRCREGQAVAIEMLREERERYCDSDAREAVALLEAYFASTITLPTPEILPLGTPFQQRVWRELCAIPGGEVRSYGELSRQLESSPRAVAGACRANPLPLLIPCHRVVAANGPGGYMGQRSGTALAIKQWLLQHEGYVPHERRRG